MKFSVHFRSMSKEDIELFDLIKKETGEKTASKAVLQAISEYILYKRRYKDLERRYLDLVSKYTK